jgi:hypothetical protein
MTRDDIQRRFEVLMGEDLSSEERERAEAQLAETPSGAKLLEAYRWFQQPMVADSSAGLVEAIVEGLPQEAPSVFASIAELTLMAWSDPSLAAALREDPRALLKERGIEIDEGTQIEIVTKDAAPLPSRGLLAIPLPEVGSAALNQAEARFALKQTGFGWLLNTGSFDPTRSDVRADRKRPQVRREPAKPATRPRWRWTLALTGALALIVFAIFGRGTVPGDTPLWGTARNVGNEAWLADPLIGAALVVAVVAIWIAYIRSR